MFLQVQALGRCGRDPVIIYTPEGIAITRFPLVVSEKSEDDIERQMWFTCSAQGEMAETLNSKLLREGSLIFVQGKFMPRRYTTRDGTPDFSFDIALEKFAFLDGEAEDGMPDSPFEESSFLDEMDGEAG